MTIDDAIHKLRDVGCIDLATLVADERSKQIAEIEKLRSFISYLQRSKFGSKSEKMSPDQLQLALEEMEQSAAAAAAAAAAAEEAEAQAEKPKRQRKPRAPLRGALPSHLPREHVTVEPEDKSCPCCGGALHPIGEDVTEQLDIVPAQFKVIATHLPKYGCRSCAEGVVQALVPERPITGGMATEGLLAHVLISKYCDHLPLYRQAVIYARQGVPLDRATLADWVGRACWWLAPLHRLLATTILAADKIFADDTPIPVLDPGRGKTKTGRFWAYGIAAEFLLRVAALYAIEADGDGVIASVVRHRGCFTGAAIGDTGSHRAPPWALGRLLRKRHPAPHCPTRLGRSHLASRARGARRLRVDRTNG